MTPSYILNFVDNPEASSAFYAALLGQTPVETSPTFVLFAFENGLKLGLWSKHTAKPAPTSTGGGAEIAIAVETPVDDIHADWAARGVTIAQPPTDMDFGRTFVALDPDGHRIRVVTVHA